MDANLCQVIQMEYALEKIAPNYGSWQNNVIIKIGPWKNVLSPISKYQTLLKSTIVTKLLVLCGINHLHKVTVISNLNSIWSLRFGFPPTELYLIMLFSYNSKTRTNQQNNFNF